MKTMLDALLEKYAKAGITYYGFTKEGIKYDANLINGKWVIIKAT